MTAKIILTAVKQYKVISILILLLQLILFSQMEEPIWVRLAIIQVQSQNLASNLLNKLEQGENFYYLAKEYSLHETAKYGGEGWVSVNQLPAQVLQDFLNPLYLNQNVISPYADGTYYWLFKRLILADEEEYQHWKDIDAEADRLHSLHHDRYNRGEFAEGIAEAQRVLKLRKQLYGQIHPEVANAMNNLALYYAEVGKHIEAESLFKQAIAIRGQTLGPDDVHFAIGLDNLASYYRQTSQYNKAISLSQRSLRIFENVLNPNHEYIATNLNNLGLLYFITAQYDRAEPLYQRAIQISRQAYGAAHPYFAQNLSNMGSLKKKQANYVEADSLYRQALTMYEQTIGIKTPRYTETLNNLADLYSLQNNFVEAESLHVRTLKIEKSIFGENHPSIATSLNNLAMLYLKQGKYKKAESKSRKALEITENVFGQNHEQVGICLGNLATVHQRLANYTEAEKLYLKAIDIHKKALGENHPFVATALGNLAALYMNKGDFVNAELLSKRTLDIKKQKHDENHPNYAATLHNLAKLYQEQGKFIEAKNLFQRVIKINEKYFGETHISIASALDQLGGCYVQLGNYHDAESSYRSALNIYYQLDMPNHPDAANILSNLSRLYIMQGTGNIAINFVRQALKNKTDALGNDHPNLINTLSELADLYEGQGDLANAQRYNEQALKIGENNFGINHPIVANTLYRLALLSFKNGNYQQAKQQFFEALKIYDDKLDSNHQTIAKVFRNLGKLEMHSGNLALAKEYFGKAVDIETNFIFHTLPYVTDYEKFALIRQIQHGLDLFASLANNQNFSDNQTVRTFFDLTLKRKAAALDASSMQYNHYTNSDDPKIRHLFQRYRSIATQIARLTYLSSSNPLSSAKQQLNQLRTELSQVQDSLAQQSELFSQDQQLLQLDTVALSKLLPQHSVLLEYLKYNPVSFEIKKNSSERQQSRYCVLMLHHSNENAVQLFDLGLANPIDSLIRVYVQHLGGIGNFGTKQLELSNQYLLSLSKTLYKRIIHPAISSLPANITIYCAPDEMLNLLPFEILVNENGKYLVEVHQINYLSCGRDLMKFGMSDSYKSSQGNMYVFADPKFSDISGNAATNQLDSEIALDTLDVAISTLGTFQSLENTRVEAKAISTLFKLDPNHLFLDKRATEQHLFLLGAPWRLHIATHGFYRSAPPEPALFGLDSSFLLTGSGSNAKLSWSWLNMLLDSFPAAGIGRFPNWGPEVSKWEDALLRSGLALAGANTAGLQKNFSQIYDGIATAYEISGMNLQGADLVVLSACETGLGDIHRGEGVFGLRRAFQLAGAQTIVMSLWKVPDKETKDLMIDFYTRLGKGERKSEALRHASLAMMKKHKQQYGFAHPYYWGAFICVGNPN